MSDEQQKVKSNSITIDDNMIKKFVWNEYLESLKSLKVQYPDDFKDTLEPTMPSDITEIFKLRNNLYKCMGPRYGDSYW